MVRRFKKKSRRTGKYKSKLEAAVAKRLGKKATYETATIKYTLSKKYKPDFILVKDDGNIIYIEVKGWYRYEDQVKMKAVKECNPSLDIRMYFPVDGKCQGSTLKNSEWCERHGFPYYIGTMPKDVV